MEKEDRIRLLKIAISCLRCEGEERQIFSPTCPTEEDINIIKKSLQNQDVSKEILKKYFPMAYQGVKDHGFFKYLYPYGYCRFRPTCSEYTIQAIRKYGLIKGGIKAIWRIIRCNPWNKGGWDPLK